MALYPSVCAGAFGYESNVLCMSESHMVDTGVWRGFQVNTVGSDAISTIDILIMSQDVRN